MIVHWDSFSPSSKNSTTQQPLGYGDIEKGNIFGHRYRWKGKIFILSFSQELEKITARVVLKK